MSWPVSRTPVPSASPPAPPQLGVWGRSVSLGHRGSLRRGPPVPRPFSRPFSPSPQPDSARGPARAPYSAMAGRIAPRPQTAGPRLGEPVAARDPSSASPISPLLARPVAQYPAGVERKGSPDADEFRPRGASSTDSRGPSRGASSDDGWTQVERSRSSAVSVDSGAAAASTGHSPAVQMLDPLDIRWSQTTVSCCISDKSKTIESLSREIASTDPSFGWLGTPILVIRMPDGKLTSSDNRRLTAAVLASTLNSEFKVPVEIHEWDESTGQPLINFIRPDHDNKGEKMMTEGHARNMLRTISELDHRFRLISEKTASHGDAILMKMFGKIPVLKDVGLNFIGCKYGYEMIPNVTPMFEEGTDRHKTEHLWDRKLLRKVEAAMQRIFEKSRPPALLSHSASSSELAPHLLSKSARKRANAKAWERALSTDAATPGREGLRQIELIRQDGEGSSSVAAHAAADALGPRPVTAPPGSSVSDK